MSRLLALTPTLSQGERELLCLCPLSLWERAGVRAASEEHSL